MARAVGRAGGGLIDLAIAAALARNWRPYLMGWAQIAMVGAYTIGLSLMAPVLWMLPFGGLLKNLPVLMLIVVWMVLERER
ncbi:DoxX-like family protein [Roseobacteraceae bacterium S113]